METEKINRRAFLKASALAGGGLLVSIATTRVFAKDFDVRSLSDEVMLHPLLKISADNAIHILLSKVEMGQGIWTTLPMLMAEELDCDWAKIVVETAPPGKEDDFKEPPVYKSTGGSETTKSEFDHYRLAGAVAREMLIAAAAKRWNVALLSCKTENGYVYSGNLKISYGEIASEAATLQVPSIKLRAPSEWKLIGKSQKRLDAPEKVNGSARYGLDLQFEGMLTAVVAHPPAFGAKVKSYNEVETRLVPGVHDVIQIPSGIAVIADHFWAAKTGRDALHIEWDTSEGENIDSINLFSEYGKLANTKGAVIFEKGNVMEAFSKATNIFEAEFQFPFLAHAPMEPLNCAVKISTDKCEVWTGTQSPLLHQVEIANFLGMKPEQVLLNTPYLGGSFGRRGSFSGDWIMEALYIAKASGKFIKLVWTREDDIQGGYYRPVYVHKTKIATDKNGMPIAWQHHIVGQSLFTNTPLQDLIVQKGIDYSSVTGATPYTDFIPDFSFELHTTKVNVPVLPWRSVGSTHTVFVVESLIDELAIAASVDPVEYRRKFFKDSPRHLAALNLAAEKAKWDEPLPKEKFRGVAVCEAMGSYVAQIVELSLVNGKVKVHRVVCAIDCGLAVNPDGVRAQMESGIIYGLTAILYGEITIEKGKVKQRNFNDYKILRMPDSPDIEVHIVTSNEKMGGAGEPGVAPIGAAFANAFFAATGRRFRKLPLRI